MFVLLRPHRSLGKCVQRHIRMKFGLFLPKNATVHIGVPRGQGGSENYQNFPELVGGGHPGVQLLCKVLAYSTRVKSQNQIHDFDLFKFINYPLELVGGDHGGVQLLLQIQGILTRFKQKSILLKMTGFNNMNSSHRLKTVKQL